MNKIEEAIVAHWGERCPDTEPGCPCCDAWAEYDAMGVERDALLARIAGFEEMLDAAEKSNRISYNGNMWRFWADKAREMAVGSGAANVRADRTEAKLAKAVEALEYYAVERVDGFDDSLIARATLAELTGGGHA